MAMRAPGMPVSSRSSENSQADTTAKQGLANSEGCSDRPAKLIQRVAPLISAPVINVSTSRTMDASMPRQARRRTQRGVASELDIISAAENGSSVIWRAGGWADCRQKHGAPWGERVGRRV